MKFFNLGAGELILILLFAILAVGPRETAKLAQQVSGIVKSIRGTFNELTSEFTRAAADVADMDLNTVSDTKKDETNKGKFGG